MSTTTVQYQEWLSANKERNYPFAENSSLVSNQGVLLPKGAFTDGIFYPIDLVGRLYLATINATTETMTIIDDATGIVKGTSTDSFVNGIHHFYDEIGRHVGSLATSQSITDVVGELTFETVATTFEGAVVYPQNQPGVRGIRLPDGTVLTGEVTLVGRDGVMLSTNNDGTIRVDVVGTPGNEVLSPIIKDILVYGDCVLSATKDGNVISLLSGEISTPSQICTAKNNLIQPDGSFPANDTDPCDPVEPPVPPEECPPPSIPVSSIPECAHGGYFYFNAVSSIIDIKALEYPGVTVNINGISNSNVDVTTIADLLPPRSLGALKFSMKG